jgi:hypothetical protein
LGVGCAPFNEALRAIVHREPEQLYSLVFRAALKRQSPLKNLAADLPPLRVNEKVADEPILPAPIVMAVPSRTM